MVLDKTKNSKDNNNNKENPTIGRLLIQVNKQFKNKYLL